MIVCVFIFYSRYPLFSFNVMEARDALNYWMDMVYMLRKYTYKYKIFDINIYVF
jgi:hypothetical protein